MSQSGRIVVLNGFPGMGKLTILRRVKAMLPEGTTCLLDNHLLIDPASAVFPDREKEHHELRRLLSVPVFAKLRKRAQEGATILMTACLAADSWRDASVLHEHLSMVRGTNVPLHWINVHCDLATLEERVVNPQRVQGGKTKTTDVNLARHMVDHHRLIDPRELDEDETVWVITRELDVSGPLEATAEELLGMVGLGIGKYNSNEEGSQSSSSVSGRAVCENNSNGTQQSIRDVVTQISVDILQG